MDFSCTASEEAQRAVISSIRSEGFDDLRSGIIRERLSAATTAQRRGAGKRHPVRSRDNHLSADGVRGKHAITKH